ASLAGIAVGLLDGLELAGVAHLCRRRRRDEPTPVGGYLVVQPQLDEAGYRLHGRLGAAQGSVVTQALEAEADRLCDGIPVSERPTRAELQADALVSLAEGRDRSAVVVVHRNAEGTVEIDGIPASRADLEHATCVGSIEAGDGSGQTRQSVSPRQRRRILYRDQHRCTIDGCVSRSRLEVHHVIPRARGGPNEDWNLTTLCWFHHHVVVHRRGFTVDRTSPPGRRRLLPPSQTRGPPG
ncbi:MAG: HNH endonuclease signature motif containing protein, partial [Acidimicrobiia bacterium]